MSDRQLLAQTADAIMASAAAIRQPVGSWDESLWTRLAELGFTTLTVPEDLGGAGGSLVDAALVARVGAANAVAVPLTESLLAAHIVAAAGVQASAVPSTVAVSAGKLRIVTEGRRVRVVGALERVPWARVCSRLVVVGDNEPGPVIVEVGECDVRPGENLAAEPRDDVVIDAFAQQPAWGDEWSENRVLRLGAVLRVAQLAGALGAIRDLTITQVRQREQFGRPIGTFQSVQHQIATLAGIAAGAQLASEHAAYAADAVSVAAAKAYVGRRAGDAAGIAHGLHGAIGLTEEHSLHLFTRRIWSWRQEFGSDAFWAEELGRRIMDAPGKAWSLVVADRAEVDGHAPRAAAT
jgi:acyl-CoA dehydrogenase